MMGDLLFSFAFISSGRGQVRASCHGVFLGVGACEFLGREGGLGLSPSTPVCGCAFLGLG